MQPSKDESSSRTLVAAACPLCRTEVVDPTTDASESTLQFDDLECPSCGLIFPPPAAKPAVPEPAVAAPEATPSAPVDPLQSWLDGAPIRPAKRTARQKIADWARCNRRAAALCVAALAGLTVAAIGATAGFLLAWRELDQAAAERDRIAAKCDGLEEVARQYSREALARTLRDKEEKQDRRDLASRLETARQGRQDALDLLAAAEQGRSRADVEARTALAQQITDEAKKCAAQKPQLAMVLAAEAVRILQGLGEPPLAGALQCLWGLEPAIDPRTLHGGAVRPAVLAASLDGRWLACGGQDGELTLWDLKHARAAPRRLPARHGRVTDVLLSPDGRWLISAGVDSKIRLWMLAAGDPAGKPIVLEGHQGRIARLAIGGDGRWLVSASNGMIPAENSVRLWDLNAADPAASGVDIAGHEGRLHALAIGLDGRAIASANADGTLRLWTRAEGRKFGASLVLRGPLGRLHAMCFSPDNRWLAAACEDAAGGKEAILLWELTSANPIAAPIELRGQSGGTRCLSVTPDGQWLIAGGTDAALRAWDLTRDDPARRVSIVPGANEAIVNTTISANGKWLAALGAEGGISLWSVGARGPVGEPVALRPEAGQAAAVAIAGDSQWLAAACHDGTVRLWNLNVDMLMAAAYGKKPPRAETARNPGLTERLPHVDDNPLR